MSSPAPDASGNDRKLQLFLVSALFLFMELAFIRWFPAQILFLTFFTNVVLLASFLGLSAGCLAARHSRNYLRLTPVFLALSVAAAAGMESVRLALQDVIDVGSNKVSPQLVFFGTEARVSDVASFVIPIEVIVGAAFLLIAAIMIGVGQTIGRCFATFTTPVKAYSINVAGSLAGILLFQAFSHWLSPVWWFSLISAGLLYFLFLDNSRKWLPAAFCCVTPLLLIVSEQLPAGIIREKFPVESWSPYYRINYSPDSRAIVVNLLGHQQMVSRSDPYPAYALPYLINRDVGRQPFRDVLIIGAGSGNDVSRALQWAAADAVIDAVEIDPVIQKLGAAHHPDSPYLDPRVRVHLDDGRNFLRSSARKYDLIVFALIDSLVLHSSISNIRLESYLFTEEAFADVRRRLKPDGLFVVYNYFRQGWIVSRLARTLQQEFGRPPVALALPPRDRILANERADGFTVLLSGERAAGIERAFRGGPYAVAAGVAPVLSSPNGFAAPSANSILFRPAWVETPHDLRVATDSWPYLYLRNPMIPELSWRGAGLIVCLALGLLWLFGWRTGGEHMTSLNACMFLLGAGFMLLETKAVVQMALMFGSTWVVNTAVFSTVLSIILFANWWVLRRRPAKLGPYYAGILITLGLNIVVPLEVLLGWPRIIQGLTAGVLVLSPVLFSGVVFAILFERSNKPEQALAYNAAGAMVGGLAEALSMLVGFTGLLGVAAAIYAGSALAQRFAAGSPGGVKVAVGAAAMAAPAGSGPHRR